MELFNFGKRALVNYEDCSTRLISVTSYLHLLHEFTDAVQAGEAMKIRDAAAGEWQPYVGIFTRLYHEKSDLLLCLLEDQASCSSAGSSRQSSVERPKHRIDFSYLRPDTLSIECNSKELIKFKDDFSIWIEKSLGSIQDAKLVWVSLRSVVDKDWAEILARDAKIAERKLEYIFTSMDKTFLERNPIISRRLAAIRISKAKEEQISDLLHRLVEAYRSAQLDVAPLETRCLLHLVTLLPHDPISDRVRDFLIEKMRITPNIDLLDETFTFVYNLEGDDIARRSTADTVSYTHLTLPTILLV